MHRIAYVKWALCQTETAAKMFDNYQYSTFQQLHIFRQLFIGSNSVTPHCLADADLLSQLTVAGLHLSNMTCNASIVTYQLSYLRQHMTSYLETVCHKCVTAQT